MIQTFTKCSDITICRHILMLTPTDSHNTVLYSSNDWKIIKKCIFISSNSLSNVNERTCFGLQFSTKTLSVLKLTLELFPRSETLFPQPMLQIIFKLSFINLPTFPNQNPKPRTRALLKSSLIGIPIGPRILASAVRLALKVLAIIPISIGKFLSPLTMFEEVLELTFVFRTAVVDVDP